MRLRKLTSGRTARCVRGQQIWVQDTHSLQRPGGGFYQLGAIIWLIGSAAVVVNVSVKGLGGESLPRFSGRFGG